MNQYFESFDRLHPSRPNHAVLCDLLQSKTGCCARPDRRDNKGPEAVHLYIWRQQMWPDSLDDALGNALMTFISRPNQFDRVYEFTRLVLLSNVDGVRF
jgi:hypothetical protein